MRTVTSATAVFGFRCQIGCNAQPRATWCRREDRIELSRIAEMLESPQAKGRVIEVEDHNADDRIVVSVVGDEPDEPAT
jgi:hypothetical protein